MENILISGASSGLGKALALRYAKEGNNLILIGRNESQLQQVQKEIENDGGKAHFIVCDLTNSTSIKELSNHIHKVDVLINNAGIGHFGPLEHYTEQQIDDMLRLNVKGTILLTQVIVPLLKESKGRILNIISTAGLRGKANESIYCASKFAVAGFTKSLQKELEVIPIRVTGVYMGGMNTPFWNQSNHVSNTSTLMSPAEVANTIFLQDDGRMEIVIERKN